MALSDGIHPRSFSGEVNGYLTADIPNLMNIYVNLGILRRQNRIVVPKTPQNDLSLLLKSVFSKLKRLGQKQDKKGLSRCQIPIQQYLNREKRAAKIAARFFNTSISVLFWTHLNYNLSQIPKLTLLLAFVITTVNDYLQKEQDIFQTSSLPRNTQAAHPFEAFCNPSSDRVKANQQNIAKQTDDPKKPLPSFINVIKTSSNGLFHLPDQPYHIKPHDDQYGHRSTLRSEPSGYSTQNRRKHRPTGNPGNQQSRHLVSPIRPPLQRQREYDRKEVGISDSEHNDAKQDKPQITRQKNHNQSGQRNVNTVCKEFPFGILHQ